jgi:hypothetical protein
VKNLTNPSAKGVAFAFCLLALGLLSVNSPAATEPNESPVAKAGEHFKVIPAADGRGEITVVANGLNYQDAAGNWIESQPVILEFSSAVICTGATYRVILATNLNTHGSVDLELPPDPETGTRARMISHPLGIAFYDPETGDSVLLAQLQDCRPEVVSNKVVYADAFAGPNGIEGAITYTYGVGHFHQDVILTAQPTVTPADFGMGEHTRLEILTEFVAMPAPVITEKTLQTASNSARPALVDQTLDYGTMRMGLGQAFATPEAIPAGASRDSLSVVKQLVNIENRTVLTEAVEWNRATAVLEKLPRASGTNVVRQASAIRPGSRGELLAQLSAPALRANGARAAARTGNFSDRLAAIERAAPQRLAALDSQLAVAPVPTGFVIDYELVQTCYSFTFQSGQTYLINSYVSIGYATFESGSVTKFASGQLAVNYYLTCPNSGPKAVLTDINDDSVGAMHPSSAHYFTGYHGSGLDLSQLGASVYLSNLDLRFMAQGIYGSDIQGVTCFIYNCWFFKCGVGVFAGIPNSVYVSSADFCQVSTPMTEYVSFNYYYCTTCAVTDRDADDLPDTWEMQHFGGLSQGPNDDYDGDGTLNGIEYSGETDPNTIRFTARFDSFYVKNTTAPAELEIAGGIPAEVAVLVNGAELTPDKWQPFSPTVSVEIGPDDGVYEVAVVLRGRAGAASEQSRDVNHLTLDRVPPVVTLTSPAGATTGRPIIQVMGTSSEDLSSIVYDLANGAGTLTDESVFVQDQEFDETTFEFTTTYFQCYDVELVDGVNTITVRATDLAGNVGTAQKTMSLDVSSLTDAPTIDFVWPQNGMHISGTTFTLRGMLDDDTAQVTVRIVDPSQNTIEVEGLVERGGLFWAENLPLAVGDSEVTVVARNANGLERTSIITVTKSAVDLVIESFPTGTTLYKERATVSGTVNSGDCTVTVNGVAAPELVPDGPNLWRWTASGVPVVGMGTATFDAVATPTEGGAGAGSMSGGMAALDPAATSIEGGAAAAAPGGSPSANASVDVEMPAFIDCVVHETTKANKIFHEGQLQSSFDLRKEYSALFYSDGTRWLQEYQGTATTESFWGPYGQHTTVYQWSGTDPQGTWEQGGNSGPIIDDPANPIKAVPDQDIHNTFDGYHFIYHFYAHRVKHDLDGGNSKAAVQAKTRLKLYTGGKARLKRKSLLRIYAGAQEYGKPQTHPWLWTETTPVDSERIKVLGEQLDTQGHAYFEMPDNAQKDLKLTVSKARHYNANASVEKVRLDLNAVWFQDVADYVLQDDGSGPYTPMWATNEISGTEFGNPALYVAGDQVTTFTGFKVAGGGGGFPVHVKGIASGGGTSFTLWGTMNSASGPYDYVSTFAATPLAASKVDFYKPMTIKWRYAHPSRQKYLDAGRSTNQVYVTLATPAGSLYHTVVHLACSKPGATTPAQAVDNTWSLFTGKAVKTWDDQPLVYWGGGAATATDTAGLLAQRNGQCGSWAEFLIDCIRANGIGAPQKVYLTPIYGNDPGTFDPDPRGTMLVKIWSFQTGTAPPALAPFTHQLGEFSDAAGVPGQNNPDPPGAFKNHFVVAYDSKYYDPSYGNGPFTSQANWENASIDGYFKVFSYGGTDLPAAKQNTTGLEMQFVPLP